MAIYDLPVMKLVVPLAGSSSRYGLKRPKWMLTMPSGLLMLEEAISCLDLDNIDEIILVPRQKDITGVINQQTLQSLIKGLCNKNVRVIPLDQDTGSQSETVVKALEILKLDTPFFVKDCDNCFSFRPTPANAVCYSTLYASSNSQPSNKSYIAFDSLSTILQIVEKKVISDTFCVGGYSFQSSKVFMEAFHKYKSEGFETYLSHIIFHLIADGEIFKAENVFDYNDWGTIEDYRKLQRSAYTIFTDFDGVLVKNSSKFATPPWRLDPIPTNLEALRSKLSSSPHSKLVVTTSRPESEREAIIHFLSHHSIYPHSIITDLPHCQRLLINDFSDTNPFPSASSVSVPRNTTELQAYLL